MAAHWLVTIMRPLLRWFPLAWAAAVYGVLLWIPTYSSERVSQTSGGVAVRTTGHATLAAVNGAKVYLILAVPVIAAALGALAWPVRLRRPAAIAGAVIASGFVILGMASVGLFFTPSALGLVALASVADPSSRPHNDR
jgi:hypothetical protein